MKEFRRAIVLYKDQEAGIVEETSEGYRFIYAASFVNKGLPISASLKLDQRIHESERLFSFFQGLLPEGWYLDVVVKALKIDKKDPFGILLATCKDTIGAVSIEELK